MIDLFRDRAAEIIAAYGADSARWPEAERVTALHVIAADAGLTAELADARALDAELHAWAMAPVLSGNAAAAARVAMRQRQPIVRWAVGTGLAASLAAVMLLAPQHAPVAAPTAIVTDDASAFAQIFTPTPDEEQLL